MTGYIALFGWPIVSVWLFRRFGLTAAICVVVIAGYLFLPLKPTINLPVLPRIDKDLIPSVTALIIAAIVTARQRSKGNSSAQILPGFFPKLAWVWVLLIMMLIGAFATTYFNQRGFSVGSRNLPGLRLYDAFSISLSTLVLLMPMLLARKYLAHPRHHQSLLIVLVACALIYSLPTLYEVRMSPQLNKLVYGFFPHDWLQHRRDGGFRPVVFLHHALWLAIFLTCASIAAAGLARSNVLGKRSLWIASIIWLGATILLAKSLGSLLITMAIVPVVLLLSTRTQLIVAAVISGAVLIYPLLRSADIVPVGQIVSIAKSIDNNRAGSLTFRFDNENILLEKAREKPVFGWGGWGRSRVFNQRGEDISVTDGYWILTIGEGGWMRYIAEFGLLAIPVLLLAYRRKKYEISDITATLCLVLAANLLDAIPNAGLTPVSWLLAGALIGRVELGLIRSADDTAEAASAPTRKSSYDRPPKQPEPTAHTPIYTRQTTRFTRGEGKNG